MKKFNKFETAQVKTGSVFEPLPKGAYVIKVLKLPDSSVSVNFVALPFFQNSFKYDIWNIQNPIA